MFKKNPTITIALVFTECMISLIPTILIIYLFFIPEKISELSSALLVIPYFLLIVNIILLVISLFLNLFSRTRFRVGKDNLRIQTKTNLKELEYCNISKIIFDFGDVFSQFNRTPAQLVLLASNDDVLLTIDNPSVFMSYQIKRKCENASVCFVHEKRIWFFMVLINSITLVLGSIIAASF